METLERKGSVASTISSVFKLVPAGKKRVLRLIPHNDVSLDSPYLGDDNRPKLKGESDSTYLLRLGIPELVQSILNSGQQTPGLVLEYKPGKYKLVYGFRRYFATRESGIAFWAEVLPAGTSAEVLYMATLSENAHRKDLHPVDMCRRCHRLFHKAGLTLQQISVSSGYSIATVDAMIKAAKYPEMLSLLRTKSLKLGSLATIISQLHYDRFSNVQRNSFKKVIERSTVRDEEGRAKTPNSRFIRHAVSHISQNKPLRNLRSGQQFSRILRFPTGRWILGSMHLPKCHASLAEKNAGAKDLHRFLKEWESRPVKG